MPAETQEILSAAEQLGKLVADHPAAAKYKEAQLAVSNDTEASRLLADFDRTVEQLSRQEAQGMPVSETQRAQLESAQARIVSHLKVKALNIAQMEFMDLLRKVSETWQKPLSASAGAAATATAAPAPRGGTAPGGLHLVT